MMNKTISAARQISFDTRLISQIKKLAGLASPGSYATFRGDGESLTVTFHGGKGNEVETRRRFNLPCPAPFSFCIAGKDILDILSCFDEVTVTVRESSLSFKSGHAKMNRNLAKGIAEPEFPDFSKLSMSPLPQSTFRDAAFASYAAAQDGDNDAAQRVSVLLKDGEVSIVATNSLMAVCVASPADYSGERKEYLLHPRFITPLAPLTMKDEAPRIYIGSTGHKYCLRFGDYEITSRIPASPSLRGAVTALMDAAMQSSAMVAVFPAAVVRTYLERAKLLDAGVTQVQPVIIKVDPAESVAYARHASTLGDIQDMFDVEVEGSPLPDTPVGFSLKYMAEVFSRVRSENARLSIRGQALPVTVTEEIGDTAVTHILLPVVPRTLEASAEAEAPAPEAPESAGNFEGDFVNNVSSSDFK